MATQNSGSGSGLARFAVAVGVLAVLLGVLFHEAFSPDMAIFANDGPLGATASLSDAGWKNLQGIWSPLYWLGNRQPSLFLCPSSFLLMTLNPVGFAKFYAPASLMILGLSAWLFFRTLKTPNWASVLGAAAVALNVSSFSTACWGLGSWVIAMGCMFLGLAALNTERQIHPFVRYALAGLAVGVGVMEGFDTGAIMSVYIAAFVVFQSMILPGPRPVNFVKGAARAIVVAIFAGLIAAHTLGDLVQTQIQGIAGTAQDAESRRQHWDFATQWSLPKIETLRVIIPGLYGYRMTDDEGHPYAGSYWGTVGQQPGWEEHHQGYPRHTGSGEAAGVFVVLVAVWAFASTWRRKDNPYSDHEKSMIRFWSSAAVISICFAWGRHAPFYQFLYQLPYFSTIRNPIKFMRPFHLSVTILFVYGLLGLARRYLQSGATPAESVGDHFKKWWAKAPAFDQKWTYATGMAVGVSLIALLIFSSSLTDIRKYLTSTGFEYETAVSIAKLSKTEIMWFICFLGVSSVVLTTMMSGAFTGSRRTTVIAIMSLLVALDLGRADAPWIVSYDYKERYATNPIIDFLNEHKHEARVAMLPPIMPPNGPLDNDRNQIIQMGYFNHELWMQHHYPYLGIETLDIPQEPRKPQDKMDYESALIVNPLRYWELTNTKYIIGTVHLVGWLNQVFAGGQPVFKIVKSFNLGLKPGVTKYTRTEQLTAEETPDGPYALLEVVNALPRVKLYSNWQIELDNKKTLQQLASPGFDARQTVYVADSIPVPTAPDNRDPGAVKITQYKPRRVDIEASPKIPCVMLFNDHWDAAWKATVDGAPATILHCNSVVRGLYLAPGTHQIVFTFEPTTRGLPFTVAGWSLALVLVAYVGLTRPSAPKSVEETPGSTPSSPAADKPAKK